MSCKFSSVTLFFSNNLHSDNNAWWRTQSESVTFFLISFKEAGNVYSKSLEKYSIKIGLPNLIFLILHPSKTLYFLWYFLFQFVTSNCLLSLLRSFLNKNVWFVGVPVIFPMCGQDFVSENKTPWILPANWSGLSRI